MAYRHLEHTADLALEVESASTEGLFEEALRGMTDCMTEVERVRPLQRRRLEAAAGELDLLMVEWLSEALYAFETGGEIFCEARVALERRPAGLRLTADAAGETWDPQRHPLKVPIKAVTYHGLRVERRGDLWRARLIFDI